MTVRSPGTTPRRRFSAVGTLTTLLILLLILSSTGLASIRYAHASGKSVQSSIYSGIASDDQLGVNLSSAVRQFKIPTEDAGPNAIISAPNNTFWFVEYTAGKIGEFFATNESFKEFVVPEKGAVPSSLAIDRFGTIWFSDQAGQGSIWSLDPRSSHFTQYYTTSKNSKPLFILIDSENDVWFTEISTDKLGLMTYPGYEMSEFTLPTPGSEPVEMSFGQNQSTIWITESNTGNVASFDVKTKTFTEYSPPKYASLKSPVGIVVDGAGDVWVSEHGGSAVVELIPSNSTFREFPTSIPSASAYPISAVATLAIDSQGRLWFVEHFANRVGRLDPRTSTIEEFQIPNSQPAYSVLDALDAQGNFWFTDFGADEIAEIPGNSSSPIQTTVSLPGVSGAIASGDAVGASVLVRNLANTTLEVTLNASSSFSPTGLTSGEEVAINPTILVVPPRQNATARVTITPDESLASGTYSIGIVASSGAASTVGIVFIAVTGRFSPIGYLTSNYQVIAVAVVILLAGSYLFLGRKIRRGR